MLGARPVWLSGRDARPVGGGRWLDRSTSIGAMAYKELHRLGSLPRHRQGVHLDLAIAYPWPLAWPSLPLPPPWLT